MKKAGGDVRFVLAAALLSVALLIGLWDIWVTSRGQEHDSISSVLLEWSRHFPILPFIIGVVVGHCFWPTRSNF